MNSFVPYNIALLAKEKEIPLMLGITGSCNNPNYKIFYPDPVNEDDCAQCGKHKDLHTKQENGAPFFCDKIRSVPRVTHRQIIDWFKEKHKIDINTRLVKPLGGEIVHVVTINDLREIKVGIGDTKYINHGDPNKAINHWDDSYLGLEKAIEEAFKLI